MPLRPTLALCAILACGAAHAGDGANWEVRGFGTAAATWAVTHDAEFARFNQQAGADGKPRYDIDSNLGLQATRQLDADLSATVQALMRKDAASHVRGELAWAFLKARLSSQWSVRAGRLGAPIYMLSDYRNVGYANPAVRPPQEVYSLVLADHVDGLDATWRQGSGATTWSVQAFVGHANADLLAAGALGQLEHHPIVGLSLSAEHGPVTLRLGHTVAQLSLHLTPAERVLDALRGAASAYAMPGLATLADRLAVDNKRTSFSSAGISVDASRLLLQSEYARRRVTGFGSSNHAWYVLAGYRFGKLMPYLGRADLRVDSVVANSVPLACPAGAPPACTPTVAGLHAKVELGTQAPQQSTSTAGLRWDLRPAMALKLQLDRISPRNGNGLLLRMPATHGQVTVATLALDAVF